MRKVAFQKDLSAETFLFELTIYLNVHMVQNSRGAHIPQSEVLLPMGQGDCQGGNRAVGDGEDQGQDGGVRAVSRVVWETAWRPVKGPQAIRSHDTFPLFSSPRLCGYGTNVAPCNLAQSGYLGHVC